MLRLELIFLHLANGGGCFRWRGTMSQLLQTGRANHGGRGGRLNNNEFKAKIALKL
jgi:hypothetical protein